MKNIQEGGINGLHHAVGPCMFLPGCTFGGAKKSKTVAFGKRTNPEEKETSGQRQGGDGWWLVVVKFFKTWPHHFGATLHLVNCRVGHTVFSFWFGHVSVPPKAISQSSRSLSMGNIPQVFCHRKWNKQMRTPCVTLRSWTSPFWMLCGDDITHSCGVWMGWPSNLHKVVPPSFKLVCKTSRNCRYSQLVSP